MKPLERIFFQACWKNCTHIDENGVHRGGKFLYDIVRIFTSIGFPQKKLYYYVGKWADLDFYNYGVSIRVGWFEDEKLTGEYKALAEQVKKYNA